MGNLDGKVAPPSAPSNPSAQALRESKPGDRVYTAHTPSGAYAEFAVALESPLRSLPERRRKESGDADD